MCLPPKVVYSTEAQYRQHYQRVYCQQPITTFDGIPVFFRRNQLDHCMFERSGRDGVKDVFSRVRAERIDWIKATLGNPKADLYQGWDKKKRKNDKNNRVAVVYENFVVVIRLKRRQDRSVEKADFVTAYQADNSIQKIRRMPRWTP